MNRMHVKRLERQTRSIMHEPWNMSMWIGWGGGMGEGCKPQTLKLRNRKWGESGEAYSCQTWERSHGRHFGL